MLAVFPFWLRENCPVGPSDLLTEAPSDPSVGELAVAGVLMFGALGLPFWLFSRLGCGELLLPENWLLLVAPLPMDTPLFPWTFRPLVLFPELAATSNGAGFSIGTMDGGVRADVAL